MNNKNILFSETIDINANIGDGADEGVTYEVPHIYADYISVSEAGIVTPIGFPDSDENVAGDSGAFGAIVLIRNAVSGGKIGKVMFHVRRSVAGSLEIGIVTIEAPSYTSVGLVASYQASKVDGSGPGNTSMTTIVDLTGDNDGTFTGTPLSRTFIGDGSPSSPYAIKHGAFTAPTDDINLDEGEMEFWLSKDFLVPPTESRGIWKNTNDAGQNLPGWMSLFHYSGGNVVWDLISPTGVGGGAWQILIPTNTVFPNTTVIKMLTYAWNTPVGQPTQLTVTAYIDGVQVGQVTGIKPIVKDSLQTFLGVVATTGGVSGWTAPFYQARAYNRKLTGVERLANYAAGVL